MHLYDVRDLVKTYPGQARPANAGINLQIEQGEIFGILGANGAGKSTLVRQMVNLLQSDSGSIHLLGREIRSTALHVPMNVGYMPQESLALNNLTVGEALYFTAHLRGMGRSAALEERDLLMEIWDIQALRDQPSSQLSGGQRRLLRLAVATAGSPPVLVLDEPTNDLDPRRRKLVWELLRQLNHERNATILLITHDAIEAEKIVQRVGIMRQGELVAIGRPSRLKRPLYQKLRLEIFFSPGQPPRLPAEMTFHPLEPGHCLVLLEWGEVRDILTDAFLDQIDDFRLYSATLEDLYLHYA